MSTLLELLQQFGLVIVFANVLLEQLGLPLPAYPTLLLAGVLIGNGQYSLGTLLAAFIAYKWWDRQRFIKSLRMARISIEELNDMLNSGAAPVILDTRAAHLVDDGWIPGAQFITMEDVDTLVLDIDADAPVVLYCSCPNEVTAAKVAKKLINRGYRNIRPLTGGIDAWRDAGFEVVTVQVADAEKETHV